MVKPVLLFIIGLTLIACEVTEPQADNDKEGDTIRVDLPSKPSNAYRGVDVDGNERECVDTESEDIFACTSEFTRSDQFGLDCLKDNKVAISCGCHDWICVEEIEEEKPVEIEVTGIDLNGDPKSCVPFEYKNKGQTVFCPAIYTDEDEFADECEQRGFEAVMCGCSDWLCVIK